MVELGEISKEEAYDLYKNVDGLNKVKFQEYLLELKAALGYSVVKTTELYIGRYLQAEKEEQQLKIERGEFDFR